MHMYFTRLFVMHRVRGIHDYCGGMLQAERTSCCEGKPCAWTLLVNPSSIGWLTTDSALLRVAMPLIRLLESIAAIELCRDADDSCPT
jgi:hypothetical protein